MSITPLVVATDTKGWQWRLVLDEAKEAHPLVDLQLYGDVHVVGWVHIKHVTANLGDVGILRHGQGVIVLDEPKARKALEREMASQGAEPVPRPDELTILSSQPIIHLDEPQIDGCHRIGLAQFMIELQANVEVAGRMFPGLWRLSDASVTLADQGRMNPEHGITPVSAAAVAPYVVKTQPIALDAVIRKLREAVILVEELGRAVLALREEVDHLNSPKHRTRTYATRIDMFDRWLLALKERVAALAIIQVPEER